jgi:hypothetical protein
MQVLTDRERIIELEQIVMRLGESIINIMDINDRLIQTLSTHTIVIGSLKHHFEALVYLLIESNVVELSAITDHVSEIRKRGGFDVENDTIVQFIVKLRNKIAECEALGISGFCSKPDLGEA